MADTKTTALTAATSWASGDLLYMVSDPAGTPVSRKITLDNVLSKIVCAANSKAIGVTGYSLTGSDATSMVDLAGTWNTSGTPTAIKLNVTNTASNAASLLMDLQVGGVSQFNVGKVVSGSKLATLAGGLEFSGSSYAFGAEPAITKYSSYLYLLSGAFGTRFVSGSMQLRAVSSISWVDGAIDAGQLHLASTTTDLTILRDAANTLGLRNDANAQTFNVYGTSSSNNTVYERAFVRYSSGNARFEIGTEHTGATARDLEIMVPAAKIVGMDKTTEDNGFINFKATADGDATSAISTLTTSGAVTHHIQVKINGVKAWIPCSTTNPS